MLVRASARGQHRKTYGCPTAAVHWSADHSSALSLPALSHQRRLPVVSISPFVPPTGGLGLGLLRYHPPPATQRRTVVAMSSFLKEAFRGAKVCEL
jgi:hypothetical protein